VLVGLLEGTILNSSGYNVYVDAAECFCGVAVRTASGLTQKMNFTQKSMLEKSFGARKLQHGQLYRLTVELGKKEMMD